MCIVMYIVGSQVCNGPERGFRTSKQSVCTQLHPPPHPEYFCQKHSYCHRYKHTILLHTLLASHNMVHSEWQKKKNWNAKTNMSYFFCCGDIYQPSKHSKLGHMRRCWWFVSPFLLASFLPPTVLFSHSGCLYILYTSDFFSFVQQQAGDNSSSRWKWPDPLTVPWIYEWVIFIWLSNDSKAMQLWHCFICFPHHFNCFRRKRRYSEYFGSKCTMNIQNRIASKRKLCQKRKVEGNSCASPLREKDKQTCKGHTCIITKPRSNWKWQTDRRRGTELKAIFNHREKKEWHHLCAKPIIHCNAKWSSQNQRAKYKRSLSREGRRALTVSEYAFLFGSKLEKCVESLHHQLANFFASVIPTWRRRYTANWVITYWAWVNEE